MNATTTTTTKAATVKTPKPAAKVSHAKTKTTAPELPNISSVKLVPLALIDIAPQVRTVFDEDSIRELADDILARGLLQPVLLNPHGARFTLIAGERRLRACRLAELSDIPALITKASAADALLMQLAENIQREELDLGDQVRTVRLLHDNLKTVAAVAETVKKSPAWVSKRLALSHPDLHWQARRLMEDGVTEDVEILNCMSSIAELDYNTAGKLAQQILDGNATRETARQMLKALKTEAKAKPGPILPDAERKQARQAQEQQWATLAAERAAQDKDANEGHGPRFIERALLQLQTLCAEPSEDAPNAADVFLNTFNIEQHTALLDHLQQHQDAAQGWSFEEWARALLPWGDGPSYLEHFVAIMGFKQQKIDNLYGLVTVLQAANREDDAA